MGFEILAAFAITFAASATFDKVVVPRAFSRYERKIDRKIESQHAFLNMSEKTKP